MKKLLYILFSFHFFISCDRANDEKLTIARSYFRTHPDSTLLYLEQIDPTKLTTKQYMEYLLISTQARHRMDLDISGDTLLLAYRDQFRKFPSEQAAWFHYYTGRIFDEQGKKDLALDQYIKCEKLIGTDLYLNAMLQSAMAHLHFSKLEIEEAISYYQQAAIKFENAEEWENASISYIQLGNCFLFKDSISEVFIYYDKCLEYKEFWSNETKVKMLTNIAQAYNEAENYTAANEILQEALQIPAADKDKVFVYFHLAKANTHSSELFLIYIQQAIDLLQQDDTNASLLGATYHALANFYEANDNISLALENHRQYSYYLGETIKKDFDTTLKELKQEVHIQHLQTQNLQLTVTRQRIQLILLIVCLTSIATFLITYHLFKRKKQKLLEAEQKIDTLQNMASRDSYEKNSLREIVLQHFNLLKKVAQLQAISPTKHSGKTIAEKFNHIVYQKESIDWEILYSTINTASNNLCDKIRNTFPDLKDTEFKVICLTIAKFSNPEIAVILNKSPHTIPGIKSQIRKKLGIIEQGNIANFCLQYWREEKDPD